MIREKILEDAEIVLIEAKEILEKLVINSKVYLPDLSLILNNLASVYRIIHMYIGPEPTIKMGMVINA